MTLFAYGTLQQSEVQLALCDRRLDGHPDVLAGYWLEQFAVENPLVIEMSGKAIHTIARYTGNPGDRISGTAYAITAAELMRIDEYEVDAYRRIEVQLESGARASVYVGPPIEVFAGRS